MNYSCFFLSGFPNSQIIRARVTWAIPNVCRRNGNMAHDGPHRCRFTICFCVYGGSRDPANDGCSERASGKIVHRFFFFQANQRAALPAGHIAFGGRGLARPISPLFSMRVDAEQRVIGTATVIVRLCFLPSQGFGFCPKRVDMLKTGVVCSRLFKRLAT